MSSADVDAKIAQVPAKYQSSLLHIRDLVKSLVPTATEVITYGMPGFKYKGKYLFAYSAFKDHMSVFPGAHAIEVHAPQLRTFKTSKGTIQFTIENPLSDQLIESLVRDRQAAIDATTK